MSDYPEFENKMKKTCEALNSEYATIRAGRANTAVLNQIQVDYYGVPTPVQQIATVSTPDPPLPDDSALGRFPAQGH